MDHRNKNSKRHWSNKRFGEKKERNQFSEEEQKNQEAIKAFKQNTPECPKCHQPVTELATALADKKTGEPMHFDCVLEIVKEGEKLLPNQKINYIGQGRFAILDFPNIHDTRKFSIVKIIEWEERDKKYPWRTEIAGLYSQVK